jgi:hypothetical protein
MEHLNEPYPDIPTAGDAKRKAGRTLRDAFEQADEVEEDDDPNDTYEGPGDDDDSDGAIDEDGDLS